MKMDVHVGLLTKKGIPMPRESLIVALIVQTVGGAMVALGIFPAIGAVGLILFTIVANVIYHGFWSYTGDERTTHVGAWLTNAAIVGGLLLVAAWAF
jgi:putative oxidoreductase